MVMIFSPANLVKRLDLIKY